MSKIGGYLCIPLMMMIDVDGDFIHEDYVCCKLLRFWWLMTSSWYSCTLLGGPRINWALNQPLYFYSEPVINGCNQLISHPRHI